MGGGSYSVEKQDFDKTLDFTRIKPYGDTMNDGKVQLSFTLPVNHDKKAIEAAKELAKKMGLIDIDIVYHTQLDKGFSYFILYGKSIHSIDYTKIHVETVEVDAMSIEEINIYIKDNFERKLVILGATTGTDAHTVGIDAIINIKGFAGHYGLEKFEMIEAYNLGSQVTNEEFVKKAIELRADVLLVSQTVTQKNIHVENLTNLIELLEAEGVRDRVVLICGGARVSNQLVKELGYDAGFGPGTYANKVATFFVREIVRRNQYYKES